MGQPDNLNNSGIFPIGNVLESENFIGTVHLNMLTDAESGVPIGNVTFEPGCRNSWHTHPGGQILLVTGGRGWYQEWGESARELRTGDVVVIPRNIKHWHGAAKDSWFVHLAVEADASAGPPQWMEPVEDEAYNQLP